MNTCAYLLCHYTQHIHSIGQSASHIPIVDTVLIYTYMQAYTQREIMSPYSLLFSIMNGIVIHMNVYAQMQIA